MGHDCFTVASQLISVKVTRLKIKLDQMKILILSGNEKKESRMAFERVGRAILSSSFDVNLC